MFKKKKSKNLEIVYDINAGIPFRWEYEIEDNTICEFVESKSVGEKAKEPICGGKVEISYIFRGLKSGKTRINFKLINFADNYLSRIDEYNIKVDKGNIIILSKDKKDM